VRPLDKVCREAAAAAARAAVAEFAAVFDRTFFATGNVQNAAGVAEDAATYVYAETARAYIMGQIDPE
jgi:hypothetical protein